MSSTPATDVGRAPIVDRQALADLLPVAVPAIPFGFVIGLAITESAMPQWIGWLTAPLVPRNSR